MRQCGDAEWLCPRGYVNVVHAKTPPRDSRRRQGLVTEERTCQDPVEWETCVFYPHQVKFAVNTMTDVMLN